MKRTVLLAAIYFASVAAASAGSDDWYFSIRPPSGGPTFRVGPYNSQFGCQDWLGSALYLHGPLCHGHPTQLNCAPIGNGYAYPVGFPYPVPAGAQIPSGNCVEVNGQGDLRPGYYYFQYPVNGGNAAGPFSTNAGCRSRLANDVGETGSDCFFVGNTGE